MTLLNKATKSQHSLLYIDRKSIVYLSKGNQKPKVLELGQEIIKDMEVVSPDKFIQALANWMDTDKILPGDLLIVLSGNVYFEHAVQSLANSDEDEKEMEVFLSTVPFVQSLSRIISDGASKRTIVISRDFTDLLLEFLEKRSFRVLAVLPLTLLKVNTPEELKIDRMIKDLDDYRKINFINEFERRQGPQPFLSKSAPKDTKNLKIMIAVFGLLFLVLAVMLYLNYQK